MNSFPRGYGRTREYMGMERRQRGMNDALLYDPPGPPNRDDTPAALSSGFPPSLGRVLVVLRGDHRVPQANSGPAGKPAYGTT